MKALFPLLAFLALAAPSFATSPAVKLEFTASTQTITQGVCSPATVTTDNNLLVLTPVTKAAPVAISGNGLEFFSDAACTVPTKTVTIAIGQDAATFYLIGPSVGSFVTSVSSPGLEAQTQKETVVVAPPPPTNCGGFSNPPDSPPSQATAAGLTELAFDDEFNTLDVNWSAGGGTGSNWYAWNPDGTALTQSQASLSNGCLTIASSQNNYSFGLSTIGSLAPAAGTWQVPFYFEARMQANPTGWTTTGSGWPAFWSYSIKALNNTFPSTELDVVELYPPGPGGATKGKTNGVYELNTIHQWTSSTASNQNSPDNPTLPANFDYTAFHIYGVLATASSVTWYVDNIAVLSVSVGPGTEFTTITTDSMPLIIGTGKNWPAIYDYVHVWD